MTTNTFIPKDQRIQDMRTRFDDVEDFISWREIANTYFQRGSSWFYHKLNGHDGNGKPDGFTPEEAEHIKAIRHYKAAYPNGAKSLLRYAQELFDNLIVQQ